MISWGGKEHSDGCADTWSNTHPWVCSALWTARNWIFSGGCCFQHRAQKKKLWDLCAVDIFSLPLIFVPFGIPGGILFCLSLQRPDPVLLDQKRENGFSGPPGHSHLQMFCSATLCYWEMSGHIKNFLLSLARIYLGPDSEKTLLSGLWGAYSQKFAEIWCKKSRSGMSPCLELESENKLSLC